MKNRLRCGRESACGWGTGGVSPAGEVLSSDGKYPKITGAAAPDPGEPSRRDAWFRLDRRGCRLVVVLTFPARCRSAVGVVSFLLSLFRSAPGLGSNRGVRRFLAHAQGPSVGADSPCQGEMSRSDKRGREGAPVLTLGRMRGTPYKRLHPKGLQTPNSYLLTPNSK